MMDGLGAGRPNIGQRGARAAFPCKKGGCNDDKTDRSGGCVYFRWGFRRWCRGATRTRVEAREIGESILKQWMHPALTKPEDRQLFCVAELLFPHDDDLCALKKERRGAWQARLPRTNAVAWSTLRTATKMVARRGTKK